MLLRLQIENYALIERAEIDFGPGLNVLTGETGSGKSILVDALGLLLGERAEAGAIRSGASQAIVTGWFDRPFGAVEMKGWCEREGMPELEEEVRLRREIQAEGSGTRSRAYVDGQMTGLGVLRRLARHLGEIHSQHEALVSFTPAAQLELLDRFAGVGAARAAVAEAFARWKECREGLNQAAASRALRQQQRELWQFQVNELQAARLQAGEDAGLEQERLALANAERIVTAAQAAYAALYDAPEAAAAQIKAGLRQLQEVEKYVPAVEPLGPRLAAVRAEIDDIAEQIRAVSEEVEAAPARLAEVEERLHLLERIKRKYGPSLEEAMRLLATRQRELAELDSSAEAEAELSQRTQAAAERYRREAQALGEQRRQAAGRLSWKLEAEVADLAMTLRFEVAFDNGSSDDAAEGEWTPQGWDRIRFLASTNPGEPLKAVAEIASGGELSRLLLGLHLVAETTPSKTAAGRPRRTLVLDEVDAGIGGRAAEAVGRKLQRLGEHFQVLCVTHLAPIATFAGRQIHVEKQEHQGRTKTVIETLEEKARVQEIARMLAGDQINETSLRHARELLAGARPKEAKRGA